MNRNSTGLVNKKNGSVIVIRKSCLTGKVVWIYKGKNRHAARTAYYRACREEARRTRKEKETKAQRRKNILKVLEDCLDEIPITEALTPKQVEAARQMRNISNEDIGSHREFFEHIMEERRRRKQDMKIRQQMKLRNNNNNTNEKI